MYGEKAEVNMHVHEQFQDLTEVLYTPNKYCPIDVKKMNTEFVFYLAAPGAELGAVTQHGLKHVSSMNNWWPSHHGETRTLRLYWLKQDKPNLEKPPARKMWYHSRTGCEYYNPITEDMAASGCGFKLGTTLKKKTLKPTGFYKFFTLLRLPLAELKPLEQKWMDLNHFRFLDKGKLAQYWVNGWEPREYSALKEYEFFHTSQKEWYEKGYGEYERHHAW